MIVINAEKKVFGRIASFAAKQALKGEEVVILNAEKAIMSGTKEFTLKKFRKWLGMRGKGNPEKGPHYSRMPDKILRTAVRKMLPKTNRGKDLLSGVKVFIGIPEEYRDKKQAEVNEANPKNPKNFVVVGDICRLLGAKW